MALQLHLIPNSHLDPVWFWDWREGLNEGLITVRTILDLMDEDPEMTYIRGESAIYQHIEEADPASFKRIAGMIRDGRWDVVGGTYLQPDTNLAATETLARHFTRGLRYFQSRFGRRPTVAWQADSFGHSAGLPEVFSAAGIDSFIFTRPDNRQFPLREPSFWWAGAGGARILCYRPQVDGYTCERDNLAARLNKYVMAAAASKLETVACLFGLGNHGGGPTRRHLSDIREWSAAHPEVNVVYSGLHSFFAALRQELDHKGTNLIPTHQGELQYCMRGCYSSVAKFKYAYRRCENLLGRAETTDSVISALTKRRGSDLARAWDGVLFNTFHDILPGSSIERAFDDQIAWLGDVAHAAQEAEFRALIALAACVDTRVAPPPPDHPSGTAALVWNPHPHPFNGHIEIEFSPDYRPVWGYRNRASQLPIRLLGPDGRSMPFQEIATENSSIPHIPWRKRVVASVSLPALGWNVLELGWLEGARKPTVKNPVRGDPRSIENGIYRLEAAVGDKAVRLFHRGRPVFSGDGLSAAVFADRWGSWGGMAEEPDAIHLTDLLETWMVKTVELMEGGPERATLWVRLAGVRSRMDLFFSLCRGREAVDVSARLFWDERSARLKLIFPVGDDAEFEVPGATQKRAPGVGEVPGGRWVRVGPRTKAGFGFASDALYNYDCHNGSFRATVVRATRYAADFAAGPDEEIWRPAVDSGELKFRFVMAPGSADLPRISRELERPPLVHFAPPGKGRLPRSGSLASLQPPTLQLLALKRAEKGGGQVVRVQAPAGGSCTAKLEWLGKRVPLGAIKGGQIASWHLSQTKSSWRARRIDLAENPLA
jgi:alpha-mannosidase